MQQIKRASTRSSERHTLKLKTHGQGPADGAPKPKIAALKPTGGAVNHAQSPGPRRRSLEPTRESEINKSRPELNKRFSVSKGPPPPLPPPPPPAAGSPRERRMNRMPNEDHDATPHPSPTKVRASGPSGDCCDVRCARRAVRVELAKSQIMKKLKIFQRPPSSVGRAQGS